MAVLERAMVRVSSGSGAVVLVTGDAGMGKTRLVTEFRAASQGVRFLLGHCLELAPGNLPFAPWLDALLPIAAAAHRRPHLMLELSETMAAAPSTARAGQSADGEQGSGIFVSCRQALVKAASDQPLVVMLEDLQWADQSSLELFGFLAASLQDAHVLLIGTLTAAPGVTVDHGRVIQVLQRELRRLPDFERIDLPPLTTSETRALVAVLANGKLDERLVQEIVRRSQGNPLFAEELVRSASGGGNGLSESLRDLLLTHLRSLSDAALRVVEMIATAGRPVPSTLLARCAGLDPENATSALRELASRRLITVGAQGMDNVALRHSLIGEAVYDRLLPPERRQRHADLAMALVATASTLSSASGGWAELAYHYEAAGQLKEALDATLHAARAATRGAAHREADHRFADAFRIWNKLGTWPQLSAHERIALIEEASTASFAAGEFDRSVQLVQSALDIGVLDLPASRQGSLRRRLGTYLLSSARDEEAILELRQAEELIPAKPISSERARLLGTLGAALMLAGRYRESRELCTEALRMARTVDDQYLEGQVLSFLGVDLVNLGQSDIGLRALRRATRVARQAGRMEGIFDAALNLSEMLARVDRLDEAVAVALDAVREADDQGMGRRIGGGLRSIAAAALFRGRQWSEAESLVLAGLDQAPEGEWLVSLLVSLGRLDVGRGQFDEAAAHFATAAASGRSRRVDVWPSLVAGRTELALWRGEFNEARSIVQEGLAFLALTDADQLRAPLLGLAARVEADAAAQARALRHRTAQAAAQLASAQIVRTADDILARGYMPGSLAAHLQLCRAEATRARHEPDPSVWHPLIELWRHSGDSHLLAYGLFRHAEALLGRRRSHTSVQDLLQQAHSITAAQRAVPLDGLIRDLARRARVELPTEGGAERPPGIEGALPLGLTAREAEVLGLIADGSTNRRIADALFVTEKTVATHVSHILTKLGVATRHEAAALLREAGTARASATPQAHPQAAPKHVGDRRREKI